MSQARQAAVGSSQLRKVLSRCAGLKAGCARQLLFCLCGESGVSCVLQACQAKDVDAPIKRFRQSMFKKVHLEEREKRKAAKARKAGRLAFLPDLHPVC